MSYYELWTILQTWKKKFSTKEFKKTFPSPDHNKVLHDMTKKRLLDREQRGEYKVNNPLEYARKRFSVSDAYEAVKQAGMKYALTGPDAVFIWTKGGYNTDRSPASYPIHLKIKENQTREWQELLKTHGRKTHTKGKRVNKTLYGTYYILHPKTQFKAVDVDRYKTDPLKDTVKFCKNNIYTYEPALEILDEMYNLGLKIEYREAKKL